jgi:glucoamylase
VPGYPINEPSNGNYRTYATPTNTQFPSRSTSTASVTAGAPCPTSNTVALTFDILVPTFFGENIFVVGSIDQLGGWVPNEGVPLSASKYSSNNPLWFGTVKLQPGTAFEYKAVKVEPDWNVIWQGGHNRGMLVSGTSGHVTNLWQACTVPTSCSATASASWT